MAEATSRATETEKASQLYRFLWERSGLSSETETRQKYLPNCFLRSQRMDFLREELKARERERGVLVTPMPPACLKICLR